MKKFLGYNGIVETSTPIRKLTKGGLFTLVLVGALFIANSREEDKAEGWKTYRNKEQHFEIKYPAELIRFSRDNQRLKLLHSIPFEHPKPCDFDDTPDPPLTELTDFNAGIEVVNKDLRGAVVLYEGSAAEYFLTRFTSNSVLKIAPGYIDTARAGSLKGFRISQGVEWCGRFTYYFGLDSVATLVVTREYITEFKNNIYAENYLRLPGVIIPEKEEQLFNQILSTFKFRK